MQGLGCRIKGLVIGCKVKDLGSKDFRGRILGGVRFRM